MELTERLRGESCHARRRRRCTAPRRSIGPAKLTERFTLAELVNRMNELYAHSLDLVVAADAVWSALPARIDLLAAELHRTRVARALGGRAARASTPPATTWSRSRRSWPSCAPR